jgi:hypothetical protein
MVRGEHRHRKAGGGSGEAPLEEMQQLLIVERPQAVTPSRDHQARRWAHVLLHPSRRGRRLQPPHWNSLMTVRAHSSGDSKERIHTRVERQDWRRRTTTGLRLREQPLLRKPLEIG